MKTLTRQEEVKKVKEGTKFTVEQYGKVLVDLAKYDKEN